MSLLSLLNQFAASSLILFNKNLTVLNILRLMHPRNNHTPTKPFSLPVRVETSWKPCAGRGASLRFPGVRQISWARIPHPSPCSPLRMRGPGVSREGWERHAGGEEAESEKWDSVTGLLGFRVMDAWGLQRTDAGSENGCRTDRNTSSCDLAGTERKRVMHTDINKLNVQ